MIVLPADQVPVCKHAAYGPLHKLAGFEPWYPFTLAIFARQVSLTSEQLFAYADGAKPSIIGNQQQSNARNVHFPRSFLFPRKASAFFALGGFPIGAGVWPYGAFIIAALANQFHAS